MQPVIGIDIGSSTMKVSYWYHGAVATVPLFGTAGIIPSSIGINGNKDVSIGPYALKRLKGKSDGYVYSIADIINHNKEEITFNGQGFTKIEILHKFFRELKNVIEISIDEKVRYAALTVPPFCTSNEISLLQTSAEMCGFHLLNIIQQPIAAVTYHISSENSDEKKIFLVYDFGGGNISVSIVARNSPLSLIAHSGDAHLGGQNLTNKVAEELNRRIVNSTGFDILVSGNEQQKLELLSASEHAKCSLSHQEFTDICLPFPDGAGWEGQISRQEFENLISPEIERTVELVYKTLESASLTSNDIDAMVLSGGSSKIPLVKNLLEQIGFQIEHRCDPQLVTSIGATVYGFEILKSESERKEALLRENQKLNRCVHEIYIQLPDNKLILIPQGEKLPVNTSRVFHSGNKTNSINLELVEESHLTYHAIYPLHFELNSPIDPGEYFTFALTMNVPHEILIKINTRDNIQYSKSLILKSASKQFCQSETSILKQKDILNCTLFSPPEISCGRSFLIQVFAHLVENSKEAENIAKEFDEDTTRRGFTGLNTEIERDSILTFELSFRDIQVEDPIQNLIWRGRTESVEFEVSIPETYPAGDLIGKVMVAQKGIPIGHIRFKIKVIDLRSSVSEHEDVIPTGDARKYENAFISYASQDRQEVLRRVQMLSATRIKFFQDILNLEPGDRWADKIYKYIDDADVFFLFWSQAASRSEWVLKEIQYALLRKAGKDHLPPEIIPIIIEKPPIPKPPNELKDIHFNDKIIYFIDN
jgi:molecular chaperone DnaK (HSP70)